MWTDEARQAAADARAKGSKAVPYHAAVAGVQAAAGKFLSGLTAHQTGTLDNLKTTAQMMAEHDKIWGPKSTPTEDQRAKVVESARHQASIANDKELVSISQDQRAGLMSAALRAKAQQTFLDPVKSSERGSYSFLKGWHK